MSAFVLVNKQSQEFVLDSFESLFAKMGLRDPQHNCSKNWNVFSWSSYFSSETNYYQRENAWIVISGCPIYRGSKTLHGSAHAILNDLEIGQFDFGNIRGNYSFFYVSSNGEEFLYTDPSGIANIYYDSNENCFSSSFLGIVFGSRRRFKINRFATAEVLMNGRQIGPDTMLEGINRLELHSKSSFKKLNLKTDNHALDSPLPTKMSFDDAVDQQLDSIHTFFNDVKDFAAVNGADTGVTGGHDSRIILSSLRKTLAPTEFQVHSFWRKNKDTELRIAEKVSEAVGKELISVPVRHPFDMDVNQMERNLEETLMFYDGHIRMHCFLTEEYHTLNHRVKILNNKRLGFNGVGGEQYRNEWHMERASWSFDYFLKYFLIYHIGGRSFTNKRFEEDFFHYMSAKVNKRLNRSESDIEISKVEVQEYLNEVYVASLMGARTNAENKVTTFITPYIDWQLTRDSYNSLPHHGISFYFQQEMIRRLDPELAAVESGYGYSFSKGEPMHHKLKYLIKEAVPKKYYQKKLEERMKSNGNDLFKKFLRNYPILKDSVEFMRNLKFPINEHLITCFPDMMPVYLSASYFFHYLNIKGKLEE